jgi:hypothetical protein
MRLSGLTQIFGRAASAVYDLLKDPATLIAGGGLCVAFAKTHNVDLDFHSLYSLTETGKQLLMASGVAANMAATLFAAGFRIRESLTGKAKALGYFPLALVRAFTVASLTTGGLEQFGAKELFTSPVSGNAEAFQTLRSIFAFTTGCTAFTLLGIQGRRGTQPHNLLAKPPFYYCMGNSAITLDTVTEFSSTQIPAAFFIGGLARTLHGAKEAGENFVMRHITPARLAAAAFTVAALQHVQDPLYAAAYALWAVGYAALDYKNSATTLTSTPSAAEPAPVRP